MQVNQIRSTFLDFFKKNGHAVVPSSPLVPHNDPTLMFTAAGMVQFKNYFTGVETPPYKTAATSQKCVRAGGKHNDLENVGYTARHHTFFEMLGNFSFGDYFKDRAIELAWNCLTKEFGINKDKLYVTVYHNDDEALQIWKKVAGLSDDRIIKISTNDNFWSAGDVGPCGPCSEIFYDHGDKVWGGLPGTPEGDGDRYIEIWNLVFMQFEDQAGGKRINLPKPSIDTGMGLERVSSVLQGKLNNFEIDLFQNIIDASMHISGDTKHLTSHRVIADHLRSGCFLIADGVMPSNEGRGYVLRRILRRAIRHAHMIGCKTPLLFRLVPTLIGQMGDTYPELRRAEAVITSTLKIEEERFRQTIDNGMKLLGTTSEGLKAGSVFDGKTAFKLYDTYGFPLDLTCDILRAREITVDQKTFDSEMQEQKKRARAAWVGSGEKATDEIWFQVYEDVGATEFLGYNVESSEAIVKAIIKDGNRVDSVKNAEAIIILNQTPFYGESGGQMGDTGMIENSEVTDTKKYAGTIFGHQTKVNGEIKVGQTVHLNVDSARRNKIRANHSATHLLHKALRDTLGETVVQKGSLVAPERLRFDFAHQRALTPEEVSEVEIKVNNMVITNNKVNTDIKTPEQAIEAGAMALFGEKYGAEVRVVSMGDSLELCGGTHVSATGDIGLFKIVSEEAIASGIRRIEALTGIAALDYVNSKELNLKKAAAIFKCAEADLLTRITAIQDEKKRLEKDLSDFRLKSILSNDVKPEMVGSVEFLCKKLEGIPPSELKGVVDALRNKIKSGVIALSSVYEDKVSLVVFVTNDLTGKLKAGEIIKEAAKEVGGSGGGRPEFAQAGGTDIKGVDTALAKVKGLISL